MTIVCEPVEGGYTVTIRECPGCVSEGDTLEQALANIAEAYRLYIEPGDIDDDEYPCCHCGGSGELEHPDGTPAGRCGTCGGTGVAGDE